MPAPGPVEAPPRPRFRAFYTEHYLAEHHHPITIALHVFGTLAGLGLLGAALAMAISPWWALVFPLVHAGPGLIGHSCSSATQRWGIHDWPAPISRCTGSSPRTT